MHPTTLEQVLTGFAELSRLHWEIERILGQLQPSWRNAKDCLNRLATVMSEQDR
jgi:hypothetical protein